MKSGNHSRIRWWRSLLWIALGIAVVIRVVTPRDTVFHAAHDLAHTFGPPQHERRGRMYRQDVTLRPPQSEVPPDLWRLTIDVSEEDADILRGYHWNGWHGARMERPKVRATVREGDRTYTDVSMHLKGSAGSFRPFDSKPAITLDFNKHVRGQKFHGYTKISLNNSVQDRTYLTEIICRELFEQAGVPSPPATHATVILNGIDRGLYVVTEGWEKPFLRRHFRNVDGNLYDGGFLQDVTEPLDTNSGEDRDDRSDLRRLVRAATITDPSERWKELGAVLDMERFISFVAMEIITCHWDGYAMNRNNYRVFHDRDSGKMIFMPHGMDQMFGTGRSSPQESIHPRLQGLVARAVLHTQEGRRMYLERLAHLRTNVFIPERVNARVRELAAKIRPTIEAYSPEDARHHDRLVEDLCRRIEERARSISDQLASPESGVTFNEAGEAQLSGWSPRITAQRGRVRFASGPQRPGERHLGISASSGGGTGSWRTRALLESGRYRFEGKARTEGVHGSGGVCLRISGRQVRHRAADGEQWSDFSFPIEIPEPMAEIELICELSATQGEAWFDERSLRLVRE